jgi:hypothetical protein
MAGYSGTPLAKKLGIKEGSLVVLIGAPAGFSGTLEPLPAGVEVCNGLARRRGDYDVLVLFCKREADLRREFPRAAVRLGPAGGLWVAWPKKASGVATDLSFTEVQAIGLARGLVDNKICAVDETYSGLRFVVRKEDRVGWKRGERALSGRG